MRRFEGCAGEKGTSARTEGGDAGTLGSRTRFFRECSKASKCPAFTWEASTCWDTPSKKHKDRVEDVGVPLSTKQLILDGSSGPLRGANFFGLLAKSRLSLSNICQYSSFSEQREVAQNL